MYFFQFLGLIAIVMLALGGLAWAYVFFTDRRKMWCSSCRDYTCSTEWRVTKHEPFMSEGQYCTVQTRELVKSCRNCKRKRTLKEKRRLLSEDEREALDLEYDAQFAPKH